VEAVRGGGRRHGFAHHMGKVHAAFFEYAAIVDYATFTTTAFRTIPGIGFKPALAIGGRQSLTNIFLKTKQILLYCLDVGLLSHEGS
jgi:hypothetical protein